VRMFAGEIISVYTTEYTHSEKDHKVMTPLHTMGPRPFPMTLSPNLFLFLGFCFSLSLSLSFFFTRHVSLLLFLTEILYLSPIPALSFCLCFYDNFSVLLFMIHLLCSSPLLYFCTGLRSGFLYLSLFFSCVQRDWTLLWEV
jgi:hypothetical protein